MLVIGGKGIGSAWERALGDIADEGCVYHIPVAIGHDIFGTNSGVFAFRIVRTWEHSETRVRSTQIP